MLGELIVRDSRGGRAGLRMKRNERRRHRIPRYRRGHGWHGRRGHKAGPRRGKEPHMQDHRTERPAGRVSGIPGGIAPEAGTPWA